MGWSNVGRKSIVLTEKEEKWWDALPPQTASKHIRNAIALYVELTGVGEDAYGKIEKETDIPDIEKVLEGVRGGSSNDEITSTGIIKTKEKTDNDFDPLENLVKG